MLRPVHDADALARILEDARITALCLGPGLGTGPREAALVATALAAPGMTRASTPKAHRQRVAAPGQARGIAITAGPSFWMPTHLRSCPAIPRSSQPPRYLRPHPPCRRIRPPVPRHRRTTECPGHHRPRLFQGGRNARGRSARGLCGAVQGRGHRDRRPNRAMFRQLRPLRPRDPLACHRRVGRCAGGVHHRATGAGRRPDAGR